MSSTNQVVTLWFFTQSPPSVECPLCPLCPVCQLCPVCPVWNQSSFTFLLDPHCIGQEQGVFYVNLLSPGLILNQTDLHQACTFNATNWSHWSLSIKDTRRMCPTFTFHTKLSQNCQWCCDVEVGSWLSNPLLAMNKRFEKICQLNRTQYLQFIFWILENTSITVLVSQIVMMHDDSWEIVEGETHPSWVNI